MPISPTYPGVYVQEVPSGVRTITGVSTSIGLFVGFTRSGPVDTPTLCTQVSSLTTDPRPMYAIDAEDPPTEWIRSEDQPYGTIVFGVAVTQVPSCTVTE